MLVAKRELNTEKTPVWAWLELYLTPKRYHLKRNRLPLFRKGACSVKTQVSNLKIEIRAFFNYFFECPLKDTLTAENRGVSPRTSLVRPES